MDGVVGHVCVTGIAVAFVGAVAFLARDEGRSYIPIVAVRSFQRMIRLVRRFGGDFLRVNGAFAVVRVTV